MKHYKAILLSILFAIYCISISHGQEDSISLDEILEEIEQNNEESTVDDEQDDYENYEESTQSPVDIAEEILEENSPQKPPKKNIEEDLGAQDTLTYKNNSIDSASLDKYYNDPKFQYKRNESNDFSRQGNFLQRFVRKIFDLLEKTFGFKIPSWLFPLLKWLFVLSIIVGSIYVLARFLGIDINFKRKPKPKLDEISFETLEENLEEVDFDDLLQQAIKERSYRVAVRLFFLKNLQSLTKRDLINWAIDKTNNDYKYELANTKLVHGFENTVYLFEHIWYGHFDINENEFQQTLNTFRNFQNSIANEK